LSAVCLGLAYVAQAFGQVFMVIKFAGAAYLLYVAWSLWRQGLLPQDIEARGGSDGGGAFLSGLLVTLGNPKTMLFYVALVPTLLPLEAIGLDEYLVLIGLTTVLLQIALVPYIFLATRARVVLKRPTTLKALTRGASGILAGTAAYIGLKAA
ncbi:MAG: LysE family translocator, partial [Bacteroidota bacterium]